MTPESRNSPLLDNGSITHVWRCGFVETDLVRNALSINGINNFHEYTLDHIRSRAEKNDSFVRQTSFKAVAVEVTDS
jgi:hypothetical protein